MRKLNKYISVYFVNRNAFISIIIESRNKMNNKKLNIFL